MQMRAKIFSIGRGKNNDLILTHPSISRNHLQVFINEDGMVFITDLGSANGTYVNGHKVKDSVLLETGDILKLGAERPIRWQEWLKEEYEDIEQSKEHIFEISEESHSVAKKKTNKSGYLWVLLLVIALALCAFALYQYKIKRSNKNTEYYINTNSDSTR